MTKSLEQEKSPVTSISPGKVEPECQTVVNLTKVVRKDLGAVSEVDGSEPVEINKDIAREYTKDSFLQKDLMEIRIGDSVKIELCVPLELPENQSEFVAYAFFYGIFKGVVGDRFIFSNIEPATDAKLDREFYEKFKFPSDGLRIDGNSEKEVSLISLLKRPKD